MTRPSSAADLCLTGRKLVAAAGMGGGTVLAAAASGAQAAAPKTWIKLYAFFGDHEHKRP